MIGQSLCLVVVVAGDDVAMEMKDGLADGLATVHAKFFSNKIKALH
jgi:hypothetical protein